MFRYGCPPESEYSFKHALVRDAVYSTMPHGRRQQLHGRIAAVLESRFPEVADSQPELLARHCTEAGLVEKAIGYWLKAGQAAIAKWALAEAEEQLHKSLELIARLPDGPARQEWELNVQMLRARALAAAKGYAAPASGEAFTRARELANQLDRLPQMARAVGGQFAFRLVRGELEQAEAHADEMRRLGEASGSAKWKASGSAASGCVSFYLGKFEESRRHYQDWRSLWDPAYRAVGSTPEDYYVQALIHFSMAPLCLGHLDEARRYRDESIAEARRLSPYTLASVLCIAWHADWAIDGVRSADTMLRRSREILALSHEHGFPLWAAEGKIMQGWCLGAMNEAEEGLALILDGLARFRATGSRLMLPFLLVCLAEVYGMAARPDEGLNTLAEAAALIDGTKERWLEAEIHRARATLLLSLKRSAAAEKSLQQALAVARRQKAKLWELRAAVDLSRLWGGQGRLDEARDLLSPVCGFFKEHRDTPDVRDAKLLLQQLRLRATRPVLRVI
jgi:tetratricopeptide (TPR) repeat protein